MLSEIHFASGSEFTSQKGWGLDRMGSMVPLCHPTTALKASEWGVLSADAEAM